MPETWKGVHFSITREKLKKVQVGKGGGPSKCNSLGPGDYTESTRGGRWLDICKVPIRDEEKKKKKKIPGLDKILKTKW